MTPQERQLRIDELQTELRRLLDEQALEYKVDVVVVRSQVETLLRQGNRIEAVRAYRAGTGCSLREAMSYVQGLRVER